MSSSLSNTNPNSFGGSFNYDSRTGLGIGSLSGGPQKGIGSNWNMGDALSSPKGEYDKELDSDNLVMSKKQETNLSINIEDLKTMTIQRLSILIDSDLELDNSQDFDELDADIEAKAHTAYQRRATDSRAKKGTDISSLGGLGNSIAGVIGIHSSHNIEGDIVAESILKNYIKEALTLEVGNQISGNIVVKSTGKSSLYKNLNGSTNTADAAPTGHLPVNRHGINNKGYGQKKVKIKIKGSSNYHELEMTPTTDGGETIPSSSSEIDFLDYDDGETSTYDILDNTTDKEFLDSYNVLSKNKKANIYK